MAPPSLPDVVGPIPSTATNPCWVFLAGAAEPRHLFDIVFCVDTLRSRGVPSSNIWIFSDHPMLAAFLKPFQIGNVCLISAMRTQLAALPLFELVVVVVTGHGEELGIPVIDYSNAPPVKRMLIQPTVLLGFARSGPGIRAGVIILGQCFAGIFNYTDAGIDPNQPELCLLGATNLNPSLSASLRLPAPIPAIGGTGGLSEWIANIFVIHFFTWLRKPLDSDGDGRHTLMDAYKTAGAASNNALRVEKRRAHVAIAKIQSDLASPIEGSPAQQVLALDAVRRRLADTFEILYLHQEPWVLNSRFAKRIELL